MNYLLNFTDFNSLKASTLLKLKEIESFTPNLYPIEQVPYYGIIFDLPLAFIKDINLKTEISLLNQKDSFERNGGIAACIKYENNFFLKDINLKGKNLIEFGCGIFPSSFGIEKNKMPKKYIASDTSKKILKIAKINDDRLVYKLIDLEKKIKQSIKYDVIVLKGVLHHTKNPEDILIKLKRILKPNGIRHNKRG